MALIFTVVNDAGEAFDVHLDAEPDTPVRDIAQALAGTAGTTLPLEGSGLHVDGVVLPAEMPLRDSPLRDAAVVGLGRPAAEPASEPPGLVEVRVVGGAGAGVVHRLDMGEYRIGQSADGRPQIGRSVPDRPHGLLRVGPGGRCTLVPEEPPAGAPEGPREPDAALLLDRETVEGERSWPPGEQLALGGCVLEVAAPERPDAAIERSEDGTGGQCPRVRHRRAHREPAQGGDATRRRPRRLGRGRRSRHARRGRHDVTCSVSPACGRLPGPRSGHCPPGGGRRACPARTAA